MLVFKAVLNSFIIFSYPLSYSVLLIDIEMVACW